MPVNDMTFEQVSTVLNSIVQQATGQAVITPTNTYEFTTVAQTALKTGYDPIMKAINQVISRTVFSIRPYSRKFAGLEISDTQWGNHVRKLSIADGSLEDDKGYTWPVATDASQSPASGDGKSVDPFVIKKPQILQTNFYGRSVFQDHYTVFDDQLDTAFSGPDQLASFLGLVTTNMSDRLEQARENFARATLANWIGGIIDEGQSARVVHLLSEYNTLTGLSLTATTVYQPANFKPFMQWVYSRIATISAKMTERSQLYQTVINGMPVMRHTPVSEQKVYLYAPARFQTQAQVLADTYHDNFLTMADNETVNYWQSIETPDSISVTPSYTYTDGTVKTGTAVEQAGIFGVIFDRNAMGYSVVNEKSAPSPYNPSGRYINTYFSMDLKNFNDNTEKGCVLLLN